MTSPICPLLFGLLVVGCAHSVRSTSWAESVYAQADALALGSGISPLRNGDRPEIREWDDNVMSGEVVGRITTTDRAAEYRLGWRIDGAAAMTLTRRAQRQLPLRVTTATLEETLSQLQTLDGQNWGCAVDGELIVVDGVVDGHRFAFSVSNPDFCNDDRSRLVLRALRTLDARSGNP